MKYLRWSSEYESGYCVITAPEVDIDKDLREGKSLGTRFPNDVMCSMSNDFPDDIDLGDNLYGDSYPIVSERLKSFLLNELTEGDIEFLPISIVNHKGRVEAEEYFLMHPLAVCDCIDFKASEVNWNLLAPELIADCTSLLLQKNSIPDTLKLFRLKSWGDTIIIRSDLSEELEKAGFVGLSFPEADGYDGI